MGKRLCMGGGNMYELWECVSAVADGSTYKCM